MEGAPDERVEPVYGERKKRDQLPERIAAPDVRTLMAQDTVALRFAERGGQINLRENHAEHKRHRDAIRKVDVFRKMNRADAAAAQAHERDRVDEQENENPCKPDPCAGHHSEPQQIIRRIGFDEDAGRRRLRSGRVQRGGQAVAHQIGRQVLDAVVDRSKAEQQRKIRRKRNRADKPQQHSRPEQIRQRTRRAAK